MSFPFQFAMGLGRHGRAGEELEIIVAIWQASNWHQNSGASGVVGLWKFFVGSGLPSLPPCFFVARFQPPGDRWLREARPANISCPGRTLWSAFPARMINGSSQGLARPAASLTGDESQMTLSPRIRAFPGPLERTCGSLIP